MCRDVSGAHGWGSKERAPEDTIGFCFGWPLVFDLPEHPHFAGPGVGDPEWQNGWQTKALGPSLVQEEL